MFFLLPSASGTPSAPVVSIHPPQLTVQPGQLAEFRCSATGHPTPTLEWTGEAVAGMTFRAWLSWVREARGRTLVGGKRAAMPVPAGADPTSPYQGALVASFLRRHKSMVVFCACQLSSPQTKPSTCAVPTAAPGSMWPGPCSMCTVRGQGCGWRWEHMGSPERYSHGALSAGGSGPRVQVSPERTQVHEGRTVRLYCRAAGVPSATITWRKEGGSLPPQVRGSI